MVLFTNAPKFELKGARAPKKTRLLSFKILFLSDLMHLEGCFQDFITFLDLGSC